MPDRIPICILSSLKSDVTSYLLCVFCTKPWVASSSRWQSLLLVWPSRAPEEMVGYCVPLVKSILPGLSHVRQIHHLWEAFADVANSHQATDQPGKTELSRMNNGAWLVLGSVTLPWAQASSGLTCTPLISPLIKTELTVPWRMLTHQTPCHLPIKSSKAIYMFPVFPQEYLGISVVSLATWKYFIFHVTFSH